MRDRRHLPRVVMAGLVAALFVLPVYWAMVASVRAVGVPPAPAIDWWPDAFHWDNYARLFDIVPMARYAANSLKVVAVAVPLTVLVASMAGFGMAHLPPTERRQMVALNVVLLMIPGAAVWLFRFQILRWLGLLNSLWALIMPAFAAANPLFVLLYYWAFRRMSAEMVEAARLEGASAPTIWRRVAMPLARPTTFVVMALAFVMFWSDFVSPVLFIFDTQTYTLPVGLQLLKQLDATNWPLLMAAAMLMTAPVVALFAALQPLLSGGGPFAKRKT